MYEKKIISFLTNENIIKMKEIIRGKNEQVKKKNERKEEWGKT